MTELPADGRRPAAAGRQHGPRVEGTFQVPCYMTAPSGGNPCDPGARLNLDSNGVPQQNGTWTANFTCMIPYAR